MGVSFALAEPSAFNAGGEVPPKSETAIINEKLFNLSDRVKTLEESQEGLKSVLEGQIQRIQSNSNKFVRLNEDNNTTLNAMKTHVDSNFALQNENIEKLKQSITALGDLITKNNQQTKQEIDSLKKEIGTLKALQEKPKEPSNKAVENKEKSTQEKNQENSTDNNATLTPTDLAQDKQETKESQQVQKKTEEKTKEGEKSSVPKDASVAFTNGEKFLKDKQYEEAELNLKYAVEKMHKPAKGNYLLGEIAFEQKRYEDAIYYYKTSATRYDKADYMPRLMLNSAKSFEAINEKDNAKKFLETLVKLYPKSQEAKEAKTLLN